MEYTIDFEFVHIAKSSSVEFAFFVKNNISPLSFRMKHRWFSMSLLSFLIFFLSRSSKMYVVFSEHALSNLKFCFDFTKDSRKSP
jgi:hypothetical protein